MNVETSWLDRMNAAAALLSQAIPAEAPLAEALPAPVQSATPTKAAELRDGLARLRLSQTSFAKLIHVNPRLVRRWVAGGARVPFAVVLILRALVARELTAEKVADLADDRLPLFRDPTK
jgi:DNA-binding transcriptional regulator YiaG